MPDLIFSCLLIKNLVNQDDGTATSHKLATGTKPSASNLHVLFFCLLYKKKFYTLTQRH